MDTCLAAQQFCPCTGSACNLALVLCTICTLAHERHSASGKHSDACEFSLCEFAPQQPPLACQASDTVAVARPSRPAPGRRCCSHEAAARARRRPGRRQAHLHRRLWRAHAAVHGLGLGPGPGQGGHRHQGSHPSEEEGGHRGGALPALAPATTGAGACCLPPPAGQHAYTAAPALLCCARSVPPCVRIADSCTTPAPQPPQVGGNGSWAWGERWWEKAYDSAVQTVGASSDSSDSSDSDSGGCCWDALASSLRVRAWQARALRGTHLVAC